MPVMDGFQATQLIMAENPTPILVISASVGSEDLKISFNAIQAGALDIIEKPRGNLQSGYEKLGAQIVLVRADGRRDPRLPAHLAAAAAAHRLDAAGGVAALAPEYAVAIGASTGGT